MPQRHYERHADLVPELSNLIVILGQILPNNDRLSRELTTRWSCQAPTGCTDPGRSMQRTNQITRMALGRSPAILETV